MIFVLPKVSLSTAVVITFTALGCQHKDWPGHGHCFRKGSWEIWVTSHCSNSLTANHNVQCPSFQQFLRFWWRYASQNIATISDNNAREVLCYKRSKLLRGQLLLLIMVCSSTRMTDDIKVHTIASNFSSHFQITVVLHFHITYCTPYYISRYCKNA